MKENENNKVTNESKEQLLLAAERTFASWIRTALAFLAAGFGIMRFVIFRQGFHEHIARSIGILLIVLGAGVVLFALSDYQRTYKVFHLHHNYKKVSIVLPLLALILFIIAIGLLIIT